MQGNQYHYYFWGFNVYIIVDLVVWHCEVCYGTVEMVAVIIIIIIIVFQGGIHLSFEAVKKFILTRDSQYFAG